MNIIDALKTMSSDGIDLSRRMLLDDHVDIFTVNVVPSDSSDPEDLKMSWKVIDFQAKQLDLKVSFDNIKAVSTSGESD